MDSASMDHYEKQLYSVFKTFDADNDEALDRTAVLDLCNALQLDDRSKTLVETLFEKPADRVTFTQFRNGLLTVLGGGDVGDAPVSTAPAPMHSDDDSSGREVAPKFVYGSKKYGRRSKPQGVASPATREDVNTSASSVDSPETPMSHPRIDVDNKKRKSSTKPKKAPLLENMNDNTVHSEDVASGCDLDHDRYIDYEESVALCKSLHMNNIDKGLVRQIFTDNTSSEILDKITVGEFFHRLNNSLTMSIASTCHSDTVLSNENVLNESLEVDAIGGTVETKKIVEVWEQAGVEHGLQLLRELGFTSPTLHITELSNTLDEELRVMSVQHEQTPDDGRVLLLQASLSLHRFQFVQLNHIVEQVFIENNKLKSDLSDANYRSQVLAQEVDENHARMESSLKNKIKQMEIKHSESMKIVTSEWNSEKEKLSATIAQLEKSNIKLSAEEARLKSENVCLLKEHEELVKKISYGDERINQLELVKSQLTKELKVLSTESNDKKVVGEEHNAFKALALQLEKLQLENKMLRDRNDELCAEVDSLTSNASRDDQRVHIVHSAPLALDISPEKTSWRDEADGYECGERPGKRRGDSPSLSLARLSDDESPRVGKLRKKYNINASGIGAGEADSCSEGPNSITTINITHQSQECDSSVISLDHFVSHIEIMRRMQDILEGVKNVSVTDSYMCESCNNLKAIIALIQSEVKGMSSCLIYTDQAIIKSETSVASVQTETCNDEVDALKEQMLTAEKMHQEEQMKLKKLAKELERSVEQIKLEYDKCEDYWSAKLEEEREAYNEDQRLSDERLNELILKITEYEEQFAPKNNDSTLPTINETYSLEVQFTDLEDEFETYKKEKEQELQTREQEVEKLKEKIKSLEHSTICNGEFSHKSTNWDKKDGSSTSSPIGYLWSQSTIHSPVTKGNEKRCVRDYQNPAFAQCSSNNKGEENVRCSSDSEKERSLLNPIQRPGLTQRSSSVGALREEVLDKDRPPAMINCSDLEGQLRRQHTQSALSSSVCSTCIILDHRCRQLQAALRHHQLYIETVQQTARAEGGCLRARAAAAEAGAARLQQRLLAADQLVKDLYLENCHLAHQHRLL